MRYLTSLLRLQLTAAILWIASSSFAQSERTSEGTDFWFGFMPNYTTPANDITLSVATKEANRITVLIPGTGGSYTITRDLQPNSKTEIRLPASVAESRSLEKPDGRAVRVISSNPCTVYGMSRSDLTVDGFIAIPVELLGTEHYVASYYDDAFSPGVDHLGGEFLIVAPYDQTEVTITTTANTTITEDGRTIGHTAGSTWSVTLMQGQTYLVQSTGFGFGEEDMTGSRVISSKPIALMTGHQRATIELGEGHSKNHLLEMMPAITHWGTEYFAAPHANHTIAGNFYRIISAEDGNEIRTHGGDSTFTLDAGEYASLSQQWQPIRVWSANGKKFMVVEYAYTEKQFGDPGLGDPFMILLNPSSSYVTSAEVSVPNSWGAAFANRITVVTTSDAYKSVKMSRAGSEPLPYTEYGAVATQIPYSTYVYLSMIVPGDTSRWHVTCDAPMGISVYGYASVDGYGYPGPRAFAAPASVRETTAEIGVPLYPNPASDAITIDLQEEVLKEVVLIDILGNGVPLEFIQYGKSVAVQLRHIPRGAYTLYVQTTSRSMIQRVVIDR